MQLSELSPLPTLTQFSGFGADFFFVFLSIYIDSLRNIIYYNLDSEKL